MLAYSNKESLLQTFQSREATYFSRSRNELWVKGKTSGNTQYVDYIRYDCDKDTLLFCVKQKGVACHKGNYSCFETGKGFNWNSLYNILLDRSKNMPRNSYTARLLQDEHLIKRKINEEAFEVITAENRDELAWEIADLLYHTTVMMVKHGLTVEDVFNQLEVRHK